MVDRTVKNNGRRCWVSQKYCATGEGMDKRCQWAKVVVPHDAMCAGRKQRLESGRQVPYGCEDWQELEAEQ
jgi:hypothetical protein